MEEINREIYYTFNDVETRKPIINVCLLIKELDNKIIEIHRGLSICSARDTYNETMGNTIAKRNAIRASKGRKIEVIRRRDALLSLMKTHCTFMKKGYRNCNSRLTPREVVLVCGKNKAIKKMKEFKSFNERLGNLKKSIETCRLKFPVFNNVGSIYYK